ncbi:MAG: transporter substrate-binding domain-containing protein [Butyricimonas paravirosa]
MYKGIPKGFHYELVKDFADYLGVKLNIEINTNIDESLQKLNEGQYDLIAMSLSVTDSRKEDVQFSLPLYHQSSTRSAHVGHASPIGR